MTTKSSNLCFSDTFYSKCVGIKNSAYSVSVCDTSLELKSLTLQDFMKKLKVLARNLNKALWV